ncbi:MAG: hypothetical protein V8S58_15085 [Lachnospiraceae bacterium]
MNKTEMSYQVAFGGLTVTSRLYDLDVTGYENGVNRLHLFDLESVDESMVKKGIDFDKTDIAQNLTLFLYPDDSDRDGFCGCTSSISWSATRPSLSCPRKTAGPLAYDCPTTR